MKKCFGYIRVSTLKQGDGVSLEAQRDAIEAYARRSNILISRWFEEKVTAAKSGRPAFNAMLKALRRREADGLVIHKIDRSARNFGDWARIGDLSDAGIDVHFATETLDFRSRGGRLSADIQAVIAADYVRNLRDECLKGMNGRLKQGLWPWAAPIGYLDNGGGEPKTIDPTRAPLVRQLFELYASGRYSIRTLQPEMARRGLLTKHHKPLTLKGVEWALSNPFYCGILKTRRSGVPMPGVHEPLISTALFDRVQKMKAGRYGKKVTRHNHLYRGLFRCARCAGSLVGERQRGHIYYRCHTSDCRGVAVREELIDAAVVGLLRGVSFGDDQAKRIEAAVRHDFRTDVTREKQSIALAGSDIERRLTRLVDAFLEHKIDDDTYVQRREALLLERQTLVERRKRLEESGVRDEDVAKFLELAKSLVRLYETAESVEKRALVELVSSNRTVDGKTVAIEPENWLSCFRNDVTVLSGGHHRHKTRKPNEQVRPRPARYSKKYLEEVLSALRSDQLRAIQEIPSIHRYLTRDDEPKRNTRFLPMHGPFQKPN